MYVKHRSEYVHVLISDLCTHKKEEQKEGRCGLLLRTRSGVSCLAGFEGRRQHCKHQESKCHGAHDPPRCGSAHLDQCSLTSVPGSS